jgi:polar amino acid transport system ATP-binding protein
MTMIDATHVCKKFGEKDALIDVDLAVDRGEVVAVIGPSGSGKSTLLRCLNGLESITSGRIAVDSRTLFCRGVDSQPNHSPSAKQLRQIRAGLGMVFQHYNLFSHMTALENITEAPVRVLGVTQAEATSRARELLTRVNLADRAGHYPDQLSGGEQQRVAIARALAMEPKAMLFDEATSALDPETVGDVLSAMRALADDGMTMVVVTHEIHFAREVADTVVVMEQGRVIDKGPAADVLSSPRNPRTQEFLRRVLDR